MKGVILYLSISKLTGFLVERKISQEEIEERYEWIQSKRLKSNCEVENRKNVTREVKFPDTFFGLYCARFSSDGETIATTFGSGCIQVRLNLTCFESSKACNRFMICS